MLRELLLSLITRYSRVQKYKSFPIRQILRKKKHRSSYQTPNNPSKNLHIPLPARLLQYRHVRFPSLLGNDHLWVAGDDEPAVLKKRHEKYCLLRKFVFLHRFITLSTKSCKPDLCQPGVREASLEVLSQQKP